MDFAQDLLTQLISGFELGFACFLISSFICFSMRRSAVLKSLTLEENSPALPELFEMAQHLTTASEPPQSEPIQAATVAPKPTPQPLEPASESTIAPSPSLTIRQLKERAKTAKIPRYGNMTKLQLLEALQLT